MFRFLHTADWQIGRQYGQFEPDDAAFLAQARLDAVDTIAALASERQVDAVLVAGDVFDLQTVSDRTIRRLFQALQRYAGPWVLLPGNHDAALADSVWSRARQLDCVGANVVLALAPGVLELRPDVAVLVAPLTQRNTYDDTTAVFDRLVSAPQALRIGLAHGSITGRLPEAADAANPIAPDRAERARLDYLALGDWHGCLRIDARTWYAGTPEQDRFRGNEPGQVLEVRLNGPGAVPHVETLPVGRYRWQVWREDIAVPADAEALAARLGTLTERDVLQLSLRGRIDLTTLQRLEQAVDTTMARVRALRLDSTELVPELADGDLLALGATGYLADVVNALRALEADPEQGEDAREALRLLARYQLEGGVAGAAP